MKFLIITLAFAFIAARSYADVSELGYKYQAPVAPAPVNTEPEKSYIPPEVHPQEPTLVNSYIPPSLQTQPATIPVQSYVPPEIVASQEPVNTYIPPETQQPIVRLEEIEQTPTDGYHYKAVRRVVYRHRA